MSRERIKDEREMTTMRKGEADYGQKRATHKVMSVMMATSRKRQSGRL